MKKVVSILLALLMIFTSLGVVGFAADDAQSPEEEGSMLDSLLGSLDFGAMSETLGSLNISDLLNGVLSDLDPQIAAVIAPDIYTEDGLINMEAVVNNEMFAKAISFVGFSVYDLYNTTSSPWAKITAYQKSLNPNNEAVIGKSEFSILKANINTYLLGVVKRQIGTLGSLKLYNAQNAKKMINFIGKLINADFVEYTDFDLLSYSFYNEKDFYSNVVELSGLASVIQHNWIDANVNYSPLLTALKYDFNDDALLGIYAKQKGDVVATVLLKSIVKRVLEVGPLEYILGLVMDVASSQSMTMYKPLEALFLSHVTRGNITTDELKTMKGLFNLVSNGNNKADKDNIQFIDTPDARLSGAQDTTDIFLYALIYLNLVGQHKTNAGNNGAVAKFKASITENLNDADAEVVSSVIGAFMQGDIGSLLEKLADLLIGNVTAVPTNFMQAIKDFFTNILSNIAKIFERLIDSFLHFGQF